MKLNWLVIVAMLFMLSGCGGSTENSEPVVVKPLPTDVAVIGNSLTYQGAAPVAGWPGSWGMAASSADKDFAHLVAAGIGVPLAMANNFAELELSPAAASVDISTRTAQVKASSMVVIELGDNVHGNLAEFAPQYGKLLDAVKHAQTLICTSTWWKDDAKDIMIKAACTERGGKYVFIGDIYSDPLNQDRLGVQFSDPGVNIHPHDWSMAKIADRIVAAAR